MAVKISKFSGIKAFWGTATLRISFYQGVVNKKKNSWHFEIVKVTCLQFVTLFNFSEP